METRILKKLYNNKLASLRTSEIDRFIKTGGVILIYKNKKMTLTPDDLIKKRFQCHTKIFKSKYNSNQVFSLIDFCFISDEEKKEKFIRQKKLNI